MSWAGAVMSWAGAEMSWAGAAMSWAGALTSMKYSYSNFFTFKQLKMQKKPSLIELTDKPTQRLIGFPRQKEQKEVKSYK